MTHTDRILQQPTFLVGSERSGTTLVRLMLDHHPKIAFNPEFEYAVSQIHDDGSFPDLASYHQFLATDFIFPGAQFEVDPKLGYRELVHSFLRQKQERDNKPILGAVVHHHFDRLLHLWPEARFIHIKRDPRDVASSVIGMGWAGNVWVGAERWLEAEEIWDRLQQQLTPERYIEFRYEDLIEDPKTVLSQLCSFMGTEFDAQMFDYAKASTYDLPDPKLVYQWRKKMKAADVQLVEARLGDRISKRGYLLSGEPIRNVDATEATELEQQSLAYCRKFRIKRYGLSLVLMGKLSRLLPFRAFRDRMQLKMNEIELKHIK